MNQDMEAMLEALCRDGWDFRVRWEPAAGKLIWWAVRRPFAGMRDESLIGAGAIGSDTFEDAVHSAEFASSCQPKPKGTPRFALALPPPEPITLTFPNSSEQDPLPLEEF